MKHQGLVCRQWELLPWPATDDAQHNGKERINIATIGVRGVIQRRDKRVRSRDGAIDGTELTIGRRFLLTLRNDNDLESAVKDR